VVRRICGRVSVSADRNWNEVNGEKQVVESRDKVKHMKRNT